MRSWPGREAERVTLFSSHRVSNDLTTYRYVPLVFFPERYDGSVCISDLLDEVRADDES